MSTWTDDRNRAVAILRVLVMRERQWVAGDSNDEQGHETIVAMEFAVRHLQGLPENWVAVVDGVPMSVGSAQGENT